MHSGIPSKEIWIHELLTYKHIHSCELHEGPVLSSTWSHHTVTGSTPSQPLPPTLNPLPPLFISRYNPWWPICQTSKPQNQANKAKRNWPLWASLNGLTDHWHRRCVCSGPTQTHYSTANFTQIRNYLCLIVPDEQCTCLWRGQVGVWKGGLIFTGPLTSTWIYMLDAVTWNKVKLNLDSIQRVVFFRTYITFMIYLMSSVKLDNLYNPSLQHHFVFLVSCIQRASATLIMNLFTKCSLSKLNKCLACAFLWSAVLFSVNWEPALF